MHNKIVFKPYNVRCKILIIDCNITSKFVGFLNLRVARLPVLTMDKNLE